MKWQVDPYVPSVTPVANKSSRVIDKSVPDNGELSITGSLVFGEIVLGVDQYVWVTFTNTGTRQLKNLELVTPSAFTVYGSVPSVLDMGDSFQIRLTYSPRFVGAMSGDLHITTFKAIFDFPYSATVVYGNFRYDDQASYNGTQTYDGALNV